VTITEPSTNGQAPPPPPPPPTPAAKPERTITRAVADRALPKSKRGKQMLAGAAALSLVWVGVKQLNRPVVVRNDQSAMVATVASLVQQAINQQPATIVKTGPMSWVGGGCAPNADALNIVGVDPASPATWDPIRGAKVEQQVQALLASGAKIPNLRVTTDTKAAVPANQANLHVEDGGTDGVPLFKCAPTATATTDAPATSAPHQ
jgi:hypothetical protein